MHTLECLVLPALKVRLCTMNYKNTASNDKVSADIFYGK